MKCLIVDDERNVRKSYRLMCRWEELGIDTLLEATDGREALDVIRREQPELLITDMCMTGMDGAALLRYLNEQETQMQILVISGYTDFDYVHAAFMNHAVDYLLKPVSSETLHKTIEKMVYQYQKLHAPASSFIDQFALRIQEQWLNGNTENSCFHLQAFLKFTQAHPLFRVAVPVILNFEEACATQGIIAKEVLCWKIQSTLETAFRDQLDADVLVLLAHTDISWSYICLLGAKEERQLQPHAVAQAMQAACAQLLRFQIRSNLGISQQICTQDQIVDVYRHVKRGTFSRPLFPPQSVYVIASDTDFPAYQPLSERQRAELNRLAAQHDIDGAMEQMRACYTSYEASQQSTAQQRLLTGLELLTLLWRFVSASPSTELPDIDRVWNCLANRLDDLGGQLSILREVMESACSQMTVDGEQQLSMQLLAYIAQNHQSNLTLNDLAKAFYLSREHICRVLKAETSRTFVEHLTICRLQHACQLLQSNGMSIADIALEVGFGDASYFIRTFRKHYGVTPSQYRSANRS